MSMNHDAMMFNYAYLHEMYKIPESMIKKIHNDIELIEVIRKYFISSYAESFINFSELPLKTLSGLLPISLSTLQRELKSKKKKLEIPVSEAFIEIGEVYKMGLIAFDGDKDRFNEWLNTKNPYFNNERPLYIMDTHKGRDLVKDELIRIEYSEFS